MEKFINWLFWNGTYMALLIAGACYGVAGAWALAVFATWVLTVLFCFGACTVWMIPVDKIKGPIAMPVPRWLDIGYDVTVVGIMVWTGHWFVALVYMLGMFAQSMFKDQYNNLANKS